MEEVVHNLDMFNSGIERKLLFFYVEICEIWGYVKTILLIYSRHVETWDVEKVTHNLDMLSSGISKKKRKKKRRRLLMD